MALEDLPGRKGRWKVGAYRSVPYEKLKDYFKKEGLEGLTDRDLRNKRPGLHNYLDIRGWLHDFFPKDPRSQKYRNMSLDDIKKYIKDNKITTLTQLTRDEHMGIYRTLIRRGVDIRKDLGLKSRLD